MRSWLRRSWPRLVVVFVGSVVGLTLGWLYRAPLLGRVYLFEDVASYFAPHWAAAARQMRAGMLPSYDLGAWSGHPLVGDPQVGALYPLSWAWLLVSPVVLYAWLVLAHAIIAAVGMARLVRVRGRSREAAALAALVYAGGAFFVLEVRHQMFLATAAWLPWLLAALERLSHTERGDAERPALVASGGFALGMAILGGGWSLLVPAAVVIGIYALARARRGLLSPYAGIALVGAALGAAQLGPALAHARLSPRALGTTYAFASSYAWPSLRYAISLLFPTWYGDDARGTYVGAPDQWELCGWGVLVVATALALVGVAAKLGGGRRRAERLALVAVVLLAIDFARGGAGLLHPLAYRVVPLASSLRCPARALFVWTLAAPLLAADGLDALGAFLEVRRGRRVRVAVVSVLLVAVALELAITFRSENPGARPDEIGRRPEVAAVLRDPEQMRAGQRMVNDVHLDHRLHNAGLSWAVESAGGYSSLPLWRTLHLYWIANHGRPYPEPALGHDLTAQGLWRFSSPIVDLLGVRWLLAPADRAPDGSGWTRVRRGGDGVDLWHNEEALPRAFVVFHQRVCSDEMAEARAIARDDFAPTKAAIVPWPGLPDTTALGCDEQPPRDARPGVSTTTLVREEPTRLELGVDAAAAGVLVVSEPWTPRWRATVDGKPVEVARVDYALVGVPLPAGHHEVNLTYVDQPLRVGGAVSLAAIAALVGLVIATRRRRRRRSPSGV
jgi:hypothetical protein